jgi:ankyrin repeat protein
MRLMVLYSYYCFYLSQQGNTALHIASARGCIENVRALLSHPNIDTTLQNKVRKSILIYLFLLLSIVHGSGW